MLKRQRVELSVKPLYRNTAFVQPFANDWDRIASPNHSPDFVPCFVARSYLSVTSWPDPNLAPKQVQILPNSQQLLLMFSNRWSSFAGLDIQERTRNGLGRLL